MNRDFSFKWSIGWSAMKSILHYFDAWPQVWSSLPASWPDPPWCVCMSASLVVGWSSPASRGLSPLAAGAGSRLAAGWIACRLHSEVTSCRESLYSSGLGLSNWPNTSCLERLYRSGLCLSETFHLEILRYISNWPNMSCLERLYSSGSGLSELYWDTLSLLKVHTFSFLNGCNRPATHTDFYQDYSIYLFFPFKFGKLDLYRFCS